MTGVYAIVNTTNGRTYIGSSGDIDKRYRVHLNQLRRGNHHCAFLQRDWVKCGEQSFRLDVLAEIAEADLLAVEQWYLDTGKNLYNAARDALAPMRGRKHTSRRSRN